MWIVKWLLIAVVVTAVGGIAAGQLGFLKGSAPVDLGVRNGRLKPPATTPNSVSSQAALHPENPRHAEAQIAPLRFAGDGTAALARLQVLVEATPGAKLVKVESGYLYATYTSALMGYVDDVEFWLDPAGGVIQVRSASRIGYSDRGANRARIEALRGRFETLAA